jgi:hypothetical protein
VARVTDIIKIGGGIIDDRFFDEHSRERGTAVHLALQLNDRGELDESTVDPLVAGRLAGWRKYIRECRPSWVAIEHELIGTGELAGIVGHVDRLSTHDGIAGVVVEDAKPPGSYPWHKVQIAGYWLLAGQTWKMAACARCVHLDEGDYHVAEVKGLDLMRAAGEFRSCWTLYQFKERHGLL